MNSPEHIGPAARAFESDGLKRRRLERNFFDREADVVARELLGRWVVRPSASGLRVGRIVETEAYLGPHDRASHSSKGLTPRNRSMFGPPGHAYVYLIYGVHHCLNFVTGPIGHGAAVLIRALEPVHGVTARMSGPGLLCAALEIDRRLDGVDLHGESLWVVEPNIPERALRVTRTARIGVDYAGAWARRLLRFHVRDNPFVSRANRRS